MASGVVGIGVLS